MDPNKTNQPGQHVTGDDFDVMLEKMVEDAVAAKMKATGTQLEDKTNEPAPIEFELSGQKYTFKTPQDLQAALTNFMTAAGNERAQLMAQIEEKKQPEPEKGAQFDTKKYIELMEKNPVEAAEYVDSHRYFGGKIEKPSEIIREQLYKQTQLERTLAAYQFKDAHPEYVPNPQNAQILENIREKLDLPPNFEGLNAAYSVAIQNGFMPDPRIEQFKKQLQQEQQTQGQERSLGMRDMGSRTFAPPALPSNGGRQTGLSLDAAEDLDFETIGNLLKKLQ